MHVSGHVAWVESGTVTPTGEHDYSAAELRAFAQLAEESAILPRPTKDLRSDREIRTANAFADLERSRVWDGSPETLAKAVEWFENRPSGGVTDGEALFACVATFCPAAKSIGWPMLWGSERGAFERAAEKLRRHHAPG
jgi:hypothetical protein